MVPALDHLDARLIHALTEQPRASVVDLSRRLGVARGTVQARLDKLVQRGVITGFGPDIDLPGIGYEVTAFTTLEITQGCMTGIVGHLGKIAEVLEVFSVTGRGDLICRIAARNNAHLQEVTDLILAADGIDRATTVIALAPQIPRRVLPLVSAAADAG